MGAVRAAAAGKARMLKALFDFDYEITRWDGPPCRWHQLLRQRSGTARRVGDYQESWQPAGNAGRSPGRNHKRMRWQSPTPLVWACALFGVECLSKGDDVWVQLNLRRRPHDTGYWSRWISQDLSEFALHARAIPACRSGHSPGGGPRPRR